MIMKRTMFFIFCVSLLAFAASNLHAQPLSPLTDPTIISVPGPGYAISVKNADFNGDGKNDILLLTAGPNQASCQTLLYLQNPANPGTFFSPVIGSYPFEVGLGLTAVDVKDLDNDGLPDVALAIGDQLVIMHNNAGTLELGPSFYAGSGRTSLKIVELDGDNLPEIVVKSENEPGLGVFQNGDSLNFVPVAFGSLATCVPSRIAIGDINNDGAKDIVVMLGASTNSIAIYYAETAGFGSPQFLNLGNVPVTLSVGQFDGLGGDDIAVTYSFSSDYDMLAWWSSQDLSQPPATAYGVPNTTVMANANFNQTGPSSIVLAHNSLNQLSVFSEFVPMMVAYSMSSYTNFSSHAYDDCETIGDLNQDGQVDIALADSSLGLILMFSNNTTTGVNVIKGNQENILVFPNPFTSQLTIKGANETVIMVNIYNQTGQKIYSFVPGKEKNINTDNWSSGVYYVESISDQGKRRSAKAIKL